MRDLVIRLLLGFTTASLALNEYVFKLIERLQEESTDD